MDAATPAAPYHARILRVNGIDLNVIDAGEGPPVLLVHGFPDSNAVWRKQIPVLLQAGYRVIAPDNRGCGETQMLPRVADYALDRIADDLVALLDLLGIRQVKLVGHDWGAVIGWWLASRNPERVERYVAMSVGHINAYARGNWKQKLKGWYILFFQLRGVAEWLLSLAGFWLAGAIFHYPEEFPHVRARLSRPGRLTAGINIYRANIGLIVPRNHPSAGVPVVGIFSDGDKFLDEGQMVASARYCKAGFKYERVEGANHWLQLHAPERVNALLLKHLA